MDDQALAGELRSRHGVTTRARLRSLGLSDRVSDGIRLTSPPRTIFDAAGTARRSTWSLCVSKRDLVTQVLDIENLGDQIDPFGRHTVDLGGLGPRFEAAAAQIAKRDDARPDFVGPPPNPSPRCARTLLQEPADLPTERPDPVRTHGCSTRP